MNDPVLDLRNVEKSYETGASDRLNVLSGVDLTLGRGEIVALVAPSGAGKSTLLHIAGLLDVPTTGEVLIEGVDTGGLKDKDRTKMRRDRIGFVYQFHHLLPEFSALENVAMPQRAAGLAVEQTHERAGALLEMVGLTPRMNHRPAELSGGEQQRVAICRALANVPGLLLADEPTGNLDPETSDRVFDMLIRIARETGLTALIATHNVALAERMDRIVRLNAGQIADR